MPDASEHKAQLGDVVPWREYAWNYFELHAKQRLKTFHLYILISVLCYSAIGKSLTENPTNWTLIAFTGFILALSSYLFHKLDDRNKQLIKIGEDALKVAESQSDLGSHPQQRKLRLFTRETRVLGGVRSRFSRKRWKTFRRPPLTYGETFVLFFKTFLRLGVLILLTGLLGAYWPLIKELILW